MRELLGNRVALFALAAVGICVLVVALDRRPGPTPLPGATPAVAVPQRELPMTPCRGLALCMNRCVDDYRALPAAQRDVQKVGTCSAECERQFEAGAMTVLRALRQCEEQHCRNLEVKTEDTAVEVKAKAITCAKEHCGLDRVRCGLAPDEV